MSAALTLGLVFLVFGLLALGLALLRHDGGLPESDDDRGGGGGDDDGGGDGGGGQRRPPRPMPSGGPEPDWWPDFEREFAAYAGQFASGGASDVPRRTVVEPVGCGGGSPSACP